MINRRIWFFIASIHIGSIVKTTADMVGNPEASSENIVLEDFSNPQHNWIQMNDPVMGGQSTGSFKIEDGIGQMSGSVAIVPFLNAPGFIKAETEAPPPNGNGSKFPDVSSCKGLQFAYKTTTPEYTGFRISFGKNRPENAMPYTYGYKADLIISNETTTMDGGEDYLVVQIAFDDFTDSWDAKTGDALVTCEEDAQYCPDLATKQDLYSIAVWGEGVEGKVDLEIRQIDAYGCDPNAKPTGPQTEKESSEKLNDDEAATPPDNVPPSQPGTPDKVLLEDFSNPSHTWTTLNDPVMGGKSTSSLTIANDTAHFVGTCAIVPFLRAPGFVTMETGAYEMAPELFPDISSCQAFELQVRTNVEYEGYRFGFGNVRVVGSIHGRGYKAPALKDIPSKGEFGSFIIPFSSFSNDWDEKTGDVRISCEDDPKYCPTVGVLEQIESLSIWGEGVEGDIDLEIQTIHAIGCDLNGANSFGFVPLDGPPASSSFMFSRAIVLIGVTGLVAMMVFAYRRRRLQLRRLQYNSFALESTLELA